MHNLFETKSRGETVCQLLLKRELHMHPALLLAQYTLIRGSLPNLSLRDSMKRQWRSFLRPTLFLLYAAEYAIIPANSTAGGRKSMHLLD